MKKNLLLSFCLLFTGITYALAAPPTPFTAGNIVVYRYGDGASAIPSTEQVPTFLDEYTPTGTLVQTIAMPTTTNGNQRRLTGVNTALFEGAVSRSVDGAFLTVVGYDAPVGATSNAGTHRVIGRIGVAGDINTTTGFAEGVIAEPRSAATIDGSKFWICGTVHSGNLGGKGGIRVFDFGANAGKDHTNSTDYGVRLGGAQTSDYTYIFKKGSFEELYYSNPGTIRILRRGIEEVADANPVILPGIDTAPKPDPLQFIMFDTDATAGPDLIYLVSNRDDASLGRIAKYALVSGSWVNKGSLKVTGKTENAKFLTAELTGNVVTIYYTTAGSASALYKLTNDIGTDLASSPDPITRLVSAPANTTFRGVAFAPVASTQPVKLTSFTGKASSEGVRLSWVTSSERNNARFEVLRSVDNVNFSVIGTVNGNNNSDRVINYSFVDTHPLAGTNYYQLNQIDYDAKSEKSAIIPVNYNGNSTVLSAHFSSNNQLDISISADKMKNAELYLIDISGKVIVSEKIVLKTGLNSKTLNVKGILQGVYVLNLVSEKERVSIKLLK